MSAAPSRARQASDSGIQRDRPKSDRRRAEHADRGEHLDADIVLQRPEREPDRGQRRADRRRGAQMAEPGRPGMEDVAGDRPAASRSRRRAAPRTDRARSRRAPACSRARSAGRRPSGARDVSSPRSAVRGLGPIMNMQMSDKANRPPADRIRQMRRRGVEIAADRRARRSRPTARRSSSSRSPAAISRAARDWAPAPAAPASRRRGRRRAGRRPRTERAGWSQPVQASQPSIAAQSEFERDRRAGDDAAVEPVGGPAGDQRQGEQRHELDDADQAELERGGLQAHRARGRCRRPASRSRSP